MARIPCSYFYSRVLEHLDRGDKVFKVSQIFRSETQPQPSRVERITGDTERAIFQSEPLKADRDYWEVYLREADRLAQTLYVANYRRDEVRRYAYDRAGGEYINSIPGPADTAVGTRIVQAQGAMQWR